MERCLTSTGQSSPGNQGGVDRAARALTRRGFLAGLPAALFAAEGGAASEAEIKAAMLFNFTKFMEWTGTKGDVKTALTLGVAGDDSVREALEELLRGRAPGRPVQVRRVEQSGDVESCHILYAGRGVKKRWTEWLAAGRRGVVTVGDGDEFTKAGGTIGFIVVENKLRFEVNLAAAGQAGVTISSRLLRLASGVKP